MAEKKEDALLHPPNHIHQPIHIDRWERTEMCMEWNVQSIKANAKWNENEKAIILWCVEPLLMYVVAIGSESSHSF